MANRLNSLARTESQIIGLQYARARDDGQRGAGADGNVIQLDGLHAPRVPRSAIQSRFGGALRVVRAGSLCAEACHLVAGSLGSSFED